MSSDFLDNPKLFRHLVEELPVGIYIVDRDGLIRFWNRGAEHLTGHLGQDVVGHLLEDAVQACDRRGNSLSGERCPVMMTIRQRKPQRCTAFYLHKNGHRTAVRICTRPILEYGDAIGGATVLFEEAFFYREESSGPPMTVATTSAAWAGHSWTATACSQGGDFTRRTRVGIRHGRFDPTRAYSLTLILFDGAAE